MACSYGAERFAHYDPWYISVEDGVRGRRYQVLTMSLARCCTASRMASLAAEQWSQITCERQSLCTEGLLPGRIVQGRQSRGIDFSNIGYLRLIQNTDADVQPSFRSKQHGFHKPASIMALVVLQSHLDIRLVMLCKFSDRSTHSDQATPKLSVRFARRNCELITYTQIRQHRTSIVRENRVA